MTDGVRSAVSDLNKEKKEDVSLIQAQEFVIDDAYPIKTMGETKCYVQCLRCDAYFCQSHGKTYFIIITGNDIPPMRIY
jgi:hypothetical protein